MSIDQITGIVRFKVAGQKAQPKWIQQQIQAALDNQDSPPESLRFQCRIAMDARENLKVIELPDGETLTLHYKSTPQFGKNHRGHPYLTATMVYSGDGENYTVKWVGDAVPTKMQDVAVKHDQGLRVGATTVALDLSKAAITPAWKAHSQAGPSGTRDYKAETERTIKRRAAGISKPKTRKRTCARLTAKDTTKQKELMSA